MECPANAVESLPPHAEEGQFSWLGLLLAIVVGPLFGLIWAWIAQVVQSYAAPLILFPLVWGIFSGLSVVVLMRFAQVGHRPTMLLAAVLAAATAGVGQHYFVYLASYSTAGRSLPTGSPGGPDLTALAQEMRPTFARYMQAQADRGRPLLGHYVATGWVAWLTWAIDLLLGLVGAVVVTIPAMRVPYCNRCRTWYRTVRGGKIDVSTALQLAELVGVEEIGQIRSPRYRLSACQGGCGPTRCELSWEEPDGAVDMVRAWLDAAGRSQVAAILDGLESHHVAARAAGGD
jgi:hypothetical protein